MRPLSIAGGMKFVVGPLPRIPALQAFFCLGILLSLSACLFGCGGGGASSAAAPPPPAPVPSVTGTVTIAPPSAQVLLGNVQAFSAQAPNAGNAGVTWSVNGVAGGTATTGTITPAGLFTAPPNLPPAAVVQVTATSVADSTKSASATVTIVSDIAVLLTPGAASVELGAALAFRASISSAGQPNPSIRWSLTGPACPSACGALDANGNYVAPQILPSPATATVIAQSVADPSKQTSATLAITSNFSLQLAAPASVGAGGSATLTATLTPVPGSNPSTALAWSLSGTGCSGTGCGILTVSTSQTLGGAIATSATYTAPLAAPNPGSVTITVTPQADPSKKAQSAITIQAGVGVSLTPGTDTLAILRRVTLSAQVFGSANNAVTWTVNGIPNGNGTVGQICVVASNPCQPLMSGSNLQVDFEAPGSTPTPDPVTVRATSVADATRSATALITVINRLVVTVMPSSLTLAPLAVQSFVATVLGTSNQNVVWQVQGAACSVGAPCGTIDANGTYTAPGAAPSPDAIQIVAVSSDDPLQSGMANAAIATGPAISGLHPASVYAGAANGFTLRVDGGNFVASSPGPGSVALIAGAVRTTACASATECAVPITPADVAAVGSIAVQIQNPSSARSNSVSLLVAAPNASDETIALSSSAPTATGKDIVVVDPTTAGVSLPGNDLDLNVAALGAFSTLNDSCSLAGNPLPLLRPSSGVATADICLFSASGLDTSMTYTVTGPGDITVIARQPAGLGIIHLTLQVPATALPGARSLFIQNPNLDLTAATGALEVQ